MSLVDYPFIFMGSRHSLSTCFELSGSLSSGDHSSCTVSFLVYSICCSPPVLLRDLLPTSGIVLVILKNYNDARNNECKILYNIKFGVWLV